MNTNNMLIETKKVVDLFDKNDGWLFFLCGRSSDDSQIATMPQEGALEMVLTIKDGL